MVVLKILKINPTNTASKLKSKNEKELITTPIITINTDNNWCLLIATGIKSINNSVTSGSVDYKN